MEERGRREHSQDKGPGEMVGGRMEERWVLFWARAAKPKEITMQQRGAQGVRQRAGLPTLSLPVSPSYWHVLRGP